jgi:hypothetical protein
VINANDTTDGKDLEFIEFKNTGENSINLGGLVLDSAVFYQFPNDVLLAPKHFWVVASKPTKFYEFYGIEASGNFSGNLGNSGDTIFLKDAANNLILNFAYYDYSPWPQAADGIGYSLVPVSTDPTIDPADPAYWRSSLKLNGSPMADDVIDDIVDPEIFGDALIKIYPNPTSEKITVSLKDVIEFQKIEVIIYSVNGPVIYQSDIANNESIDLKSLGVKTGMYFIRVETNTLIETSKLIFTE